MDHHLPIKFLRLEWDAVLPSYATAQAAGLDLAAFCPDGAVTIKPGERKLLRTGVSVRLPPGSEAQIRPRSGIALEHGVTVLNSPGTVDPDYEGELMILLVNLGTAPFKVATGDRIAQLVVAPVLHPDVHEGRKPLRRRGSRGFGHTGR